MSLKEKMNLGCNLLMARPTSDLFADSPWHNSEAPWCLVSSAAFWIKRCVTWGQHSQFVNSTHLGMHSSGEPRHLCHRQACESFASPRLWRQRHCGQNSVLLKIILLAWPMPTDLGNWSNCLLSRIGNWIPWILGSWLIWSINYFLIEV